MSDIAIRVENLSKQYHIGQLHQRHDTLRDALAAGLGRFRRSAQPKTSDKDDTFWALKDVSFEVKRGEVVGIIGRNGAGKSTLLKILTRITEPTRGRAELHGRVGSLLEVGTGFHPELTGRENIYLSGTILGMKKSEIDRRFDEIVDFSGVEKFIDTPIKRYSSGMNVRLGFAVAAHLDSEILLIDEVLAVGDVEFQQKCLGKIGEVAGEGRTIFLVSHNMVAIQNLCHSALLVDKGRLILMGSAADVVSHYLGTTNRSSNGQQLLEKVNGIGINVRVKAENLGSVINPGDTIEFIVNISTDRTLEKGGLGVGINSLQGQRIVTLHTHYQTTLNWQIANTCSFVAEWPECFLNPDSYIVEISVFDGKKTIANWPNAGRFTIVESDYFGTGKLPNTRYQGHVLAHCKWHVTIG